MEDVTKTRIKDGLNSTTFGEENAHGSIDLTDEQTIFGRRSSLARSPPLRERALSAGDLNRHSLEESRKKRKAQDTYLEAPERESYKRRENPVTVVVKNWIAAIAKYSQVLDKLVEENPNTKKEIKEGVSRLRRSMDAIKKPDVQQWLEGNRWEVAPKQVTQSSVQTDCNESMETDWETRLKKVESELKFLKEANEGFQNENGRLRERNKALTVENARLRATLETNKEEVATPEGIEGCRTKEEFLGIMNKKWPEKIYTAVFPAKGSPLGANVDTDLLFLEEEGPEAQINLGIRRAFEERYPEVKEATETLVATVTTSYKDAQGVSKQNVRWILKATVDDDLFGTMVHIKQIMREQGRKKLAIYPPGTDPTGDTTRKMLECVFRDSPVKCLLYQRKGRKGTKGADEKENVDLEPGSTAVSRARRPDVLVVSKDGKSYSDILREVKSRVRPNTSAGKAIRNIRESRDKSKMVIVLNKGEAEAREELVREIRGLEAVKVRTSVDQGLDTIMLTGMDGITTKEEVLDAVCEETGVDRGLVVVGEPRKAYGGSQSVSVRLPRAGATTLQKKVRIRVGLNLCLIRERVDVVRCFRCWQYGHLGRECGAVTDQSNCCWKCGDERHKAADCTLQPRCLTCKATGHTAGSGACPEFRKAVARERKARKKKRGY